MVHPGFPPSVRTFRTIWISDLHLGARGCHAERILDLLRSTESEKLYLVGDIVDGWALRRAWHWPQIHNDVVQKLLRKARKGTDVVFIPGNHDAFARQFTDLAFGGIDVRREDYHTTADGRRLLVLHGDDFDGIVRFTPWLSKLGARAYDGVLALNTIVTRVRDRRGKPYWSLAAFVKSRAKKAVQYIAEFEKVVAARAREAGVDGIVCGHIHKPEIRTVEGILYANCGDWVENCTALAERPDGSLEIIRWTDLAVSSPSLGDGQASVIPDLKASAADRP